MPKKRGKKYQSAYASINKNKEYSLLEAIQNVKSIAYAKFDETLEAHFKIKYKSVQNIRGTIALPYGTGKQVKVLVFADGESAEDAKKAGATYVGYQELIDKVKSGWLDFDYVVSTPFLMKDVGKLGPVLGPRNLMPNPKLGTVTTDIKNIVQQLKKGLVTYKSDKTGVIHLGLGKLSFSDEHLVENVKSAFQTILKDKASDAKGDYVVSAAFSGTHTPSINVPVAEMKKV